MDDQPSKIEQNIPDFNSQNASLSFLAKISKFYKRTQITIFFFVLFPSILTAAVGITGLALYQGFKDILFGILTIVFAVAVLAGTIVTIYLTRKVSNISHRQTLFLANVSHELRSPLTAIKLHTETLLKRPEMDPHDNLNFIMEATTRLENLVQQILQWKIITSKNKIIETEKIKANEPLIIALDNFKRSHLKNQLNLFIDLCDSAPTMDLDLKSMSIAIYNLIDNAYKYSEKGKKIIVRSSLHKDSKGNNLYFEYEIIDQGIGISKDEREIIFKEFYRSKNDLLGEAGIGLGLGIVQEIVKSHHGIVNIESSSDQGSTFSIKIPCQTD
ncbi:MAG: HAMP domain-containing sensor histidine kinase [Deltaproteobacteria bacterium]|nr:HAMP domain-containing sensor histidine kinase [Deltaproteobacteria bacterium]